MRLNLSSTLFFSSILFVGLCSLTLKAQETDRVSLSLGEYLRLKELEKKKDGPSFATVESAKVEGVYGKSLSLTFSGSNVGEDKLVEVLSLQGSPFELKGCEGTEFKVENGQLKLLAKGSRFKIKCGAQPRTWNDINFQILNVVALDVNVADADSVINNSGAGSFQIRLLRKAPVQVISENLPLSINAKYKLVFQPEDSTFNYYFAIQNPSRSKKEFRFPVRKSEIVQNINASVDYQEKEGAIVLSLLPGNNSFSLSGRFNAESFSPPIETEQSYLLVTSHPTIQAKIESSAKRIDPAQSGMQGNYPSTRAFLLSKKDKVSWSLKKLETFATTGFSLNNISHNYYVPRKGAGLAELQMGIENKGVPEIPLAIPGQVTYLEIDGVSQILSKDSEGRLLLQLPSGFHQVFVQYLSKMKHHAWADFLDLHFPSLPTLASQATMSVGFVEGAEVPFAAGFDLAQTDWTLKRLVWAIIAFFFLSWVLKKTGFGKKQKILASTLFALMCFIQSNIFWLMAGTLFFMEIWKRRFLLQSEFNKLTKWMKVLLTGALSFALFIFIVTGTLLRPNYMRVDSDFLEGNADKAYDAPMTSNAPMGSAVGGARGVSKQMLAKKGKSRNEESFDEAGDFENQISADESLGGIGGTSASASNNEDYQGLPTKVQVPPISRWVYFQQKMLEGNSVPEMKLFYFDPSITRIKLFLFVALFAYLMWRERKLWIDSYFVSK